MALRSLAQHRSGSELARVCALTLTSPFFDGWNDTARSAIGGPEARDPSDPAMDGAVTFDLRRMQE